MSGLRSWTGSEFHKRGPAAAKVLLSTDLDLRPLRTKINCEFKYYYCSDICLHVSPLRYHLSLHSLRIFCKAQFPALRNARSDRKTRFWACVACVACVRLETELNTNTVLQVKRYIKRSCATWIVVALTFVLLVIAAIQLSLTYLYGGGSDEGSADKKFKTVLWYFSRIILPLAVLVVNVIIIREACRSSSNTDEATEDQEDQKHQDPPTNTAVPTAMIVALALIYLTLDALPTVFHAILYLVPDKEWCEQSSRPMLDAIDVTYMVTIHLFPLMYAYKFLVYVFAGREFRLALCCSRCCKESATDRRGAGAEVAVNVAVDV